MTVDVWKHMSNGQEFLSNGTLESQIAYLNRIGMTILDPVQMPVRQEQQVESQAFKQWFGDWQKQQRIERLRSSISIEISGKEIPSSLNLKEYRRNALEFGRSLTGVYRNDDTGVEIRFSGGSRLGGVKEILQHDYKDVAHLQSIAAVPAIIKNSIYIDSVINEDRTKHPNVSFYEYYVCGLNIGGVEHTVKAVVANSIDGYRYYDHKLTQIEKGKLLDLLASYGYPASSGLSSVTSQGDSVGNHPANGSWESNISPLSGYKDTRLFSILQTNSSKIVDENGRPLVVEHATNADFTEFDINHLGDNSQDKGLFGSGFYFGTQAPGWMQGAKNVMKVYLDIKHPFEIEDAVKNDLYTEIVEKLDTPAMRELTVKGFNGNETKLGYLINHIRNIDTDIAKGYHLLDIKENPEYQAYKPTDQAKVWREREIARRTGIGSLGLSWQVLISEHLGSEAFTAAAKQDGYDGVIVDRGDGYKEYVAFEPNQIKSATDNVGLFSSKSNDIRAMRVKHPYKIYHGDGLHLVDFGDFDMSNDRALLTIAKAYSGSIANIDIDGRVKSFVGFNSADDAELFAHRVEHLLEERKGGKVDDIVRDEMIVRLKEMGIDVSTDWRKGQDILRTTYLQEINRDSLEYRQKVSDAALRIDQRIEELELNRPNSEELDEQLASRTPRQEPTSPQLSGNMNISSSGAKLLKNVEKSKKIHIIFTDASPAFSLW